MSTTRINKKSTGSKNLLPNRTQLTTVLEPVKITKDKILNNLVVTGESQQPRYRGLPPAQSQPRGSIVYDFITNKFWGRVREGWSTMSGGTSSGPVIVSPDSQFERVVYPKTAISATVGKTIVSGGEPGVVQWGARVANINDDYGNSISVNGNGDIVVAGSYLNTLVQIYNAGGTFSNISLANSGFYDAFIAKWNSNGEAEWGARLAGVDFDAGYAIASNNTGDIVATGLYSSSPVEIYNAGGTLSNISLPNSGVNDAFIAKWNGDGVALWGARVSGVNDERDIAINNIGDIVATGAYQGPVEIYNAGGTLSNISLPISGFNDAFVAKWNSNGEAQWAARVAGLNTVIPYGIAINDIGDIVVTGYYINTVEIYNAGGTLSNISLPSSVGVDAFVAKWNSNGEAQWAARVAGVSVDYGYGIAINNIGDVVATGYYTDTVEIYNTGGTLSNISLPNSAAAAAFIAKWNSNGATQWASRVAGVSADVGFGIAINNNGDIVATGSYSSSPVEIYNAGGTLSNISLPNSGFSDAFIANWNSNGETQWASRIAGVSDDYGYSIAINDIGDIVATGNYQETVEIYNAGGTLSVISLPNSGSTDAFIVKYTSGLFSMTLGNPTVDGFTKLIAASIGQVLVTPDSTVNYSNDKILLVPSTSVDMMWDAVSQNWIVNSLTGTLV